MLGHDENFGAAKTLDPSFQPEKPLNPLGLGSTSSRVGTGFGNGQEWNAGEHANVYDAVRENTGVVVEKMDPRVDFARSLADPALQSIASRVDFVANENEGSSIQTTDQIRHSAFAVLVATPKLDAVCRQDVSGIELGLIARNVDLAEEDRLMSVQDKTGYHNHHASSSSRLV
eukprot:1666775-Rhodomonas_salina.3